MFAYDEPLSHIIYAAADMLLVPSMFEPCGLTQVGGCMDRVGRRHAAIGFFQDTKAWGAAVCVFYMHAWKGWNFGTTFRNGGELTWVFVPCVIIPCR